jgi:hypothetical protein
MTDFARVTAALPREAVPSEKGSLRGWFYAVGFVGLATLHVTHSRAEARLVADRLVVLSGGRLAERPVADLDAPAADSVPGDCVLGIGSHLVNSISDARASCAGTDRGDRLLPRAARPCGSRAGGAPPGRCARPGEPLVDPLGGKTYLYAVVVGFLFFLIGLFVFVRVPQERSARIFFLLCVLFLLFFVCRLRPASYWWIDNLVQNTGTVSLFLLPAVFLHFFLIFPREKRLTFAKADEWTGVSPARWKSWLQEFLSATSFSRCVPAAPGARRLHPLRGAALLLGPSRGLPDPRDPGAGALGIHARRPGRAPAGSPRSRRDDPRDDPIRDARDRPALRL